MLNALLIAHCSGAHNPDVAFYALAAAGLAILWMIMSPLNERTPSALETLQAESLALADRALDALTSQESSK